MFERNNFRGLVMIVIGAITFLPGSLLLGQKDNKNKAPKPIPADARAVLWRAPTNISSRDLFWGEGGESMKPDLSKVTFVADETSSYSKKYRVRCRSSVSLGRWIFRRYYLPGSACRH